MPTLSSEIVVIIPAAFPSRESSRLGTRSLLDIFGKPLITHQINNIREILPDSKIIIVSGGDEVKAVRKVCKPFIKVKVIDNESWNSTGVCKTISDGIGESGNKHILIVFGDLVFTKRAIFDSIPEVNGSFMLTGPTLKKNKNVGMNIDQNQNVCSMAYGLEHQWLQMAYFSKDLKNLFLSIASVPKKKSWLFHEVMNEVIDGGGIIKPSITKTIVKDIDTLQDYVSIIED